MMRTAAMALVLASPAVAQVSLEAGRVHELRLLPAPDAPLRGPRFAPVTIEEFACFPCPPCAEIQEALRGALRRHGDHVRLLFRHFPEARFAHAQAAAEAAREADAQGRFWPYHDALFSRGGKLDRDDLLRIAVEVGLDATRLERALQDGRHRQAVRTEEARARARSIHEAPTLVVNGKLLAGPRAAYDLEQAIDEAASRAREALSRGVPLDRLFETLVGVAIGPAVVREPVPVGQAPVRGSPDARVTLVLFGDLADAQVGTALVGLEAVRGAYPRDVRLAFRHGPGGRPNSDAVAQAAVEAQAQGRFWDLVEQLRFPPSDRAGLLRAAQAAGIDPDALGAALADGRHQGTVDADRVEAARLSVERSALFVNGRRLAPDTGEADLRALVEEERRGGFLGRL